MGQENSQKKIDKLARVRENQRKSRAKKQAHIRDLEQKLALSEEQARRKDVDHRLAVQKLQAENRRLRHFLVCSGFSPSEIDGYLQTGDDPARSRKIAIPPLRPSAGGFETHCREGVSACSSASPENQTDSQTCYKVEGPVAKSDPGVETIPPQKYPIEMPTKPQSFGQEQSICGCVPGDAESWPKNEDVLNTTLCAIAEELINQYNTCGMDMAEIRRKLCAGFSKGLTTEDGCRVQNQILFQVLDEISN
ncbi:hypothetical protein EYZ11_003517 [Aspergillus tanneri]|uniref:BZIP domain-containing protein n=1 Tax=Aspergillus tanneri TaxID=1220188 RepID=A0A4S3JN59_9EURO|nr:uncharacterized protein ATNIH1004_008911 [Aspergillus tanneri]KAA8644704.1 hypothetical protein ATNIH1004_008911 [Aspergillus tanneri]THC97013.1 hypothetical protein EYZ11_003517 [Aspergillus tanneri]